MFSRLLKLQGVLAFLASTIVFLIIFVPLMYSGYRLFEAFTLESFNKPYQYSTEITREFVDNVVPLEINTAQGQACDQQLLTAMRMAEFSSVNLRNIGYILDGKVVCSTYSGLLKEPRIVGLNRKFSMLNGVTVWPKEPLKLFNEDAESLVIQYGRFNSALSFSDRTFLLNDSSSHMNFLFDHGSNFLVSGDQALYNSPYTQGTDDRIFFHYPLLASRRCHTYEQDTSISCFVIAVDLQDYLYKNRGNALVLFAFALGLFLVLLRTTQHYLNRAFSLRNQVRYGLNQAQILTYYQPVVDVSSNQVLGVEVLCRWQDAHGKILPPGVFLPHVEALGFQPQLTELVIRKAVSELQSRRLLGHFRVAFNAYPSDIEQGVVYRTLNEVLPKEQRAHITVEVTEQQVNDLESMTDQLTLLRAEGCKIAIDDFGTGFSNLSQLRDLKADYLKIDKSFVDDLDHNSIINTLIPNIIDIAHSNAMEVIAEGVERTSQQQALQNAGVICCQGYLYSKPVPLDALEIYLASPSISTDLSREDAPAT